MKAHAAPHKSRRPTPSGVFAGGMQKGLLHDSNVPLPWEQRVSFSKDIAAGMVYLLSKSIMHRDLNSNNCLVKEDCSVMVADFGLARIMRSDKVRHGP
ncbi:hypothetical protein OUZ56_000001 [Daphnia magna]|uniref:Protein kinase domain-containing protein n=1 Tax=Daphnia magna TaxID=35525 RepID=A0ABQ9ZYE9_9CRUS|nr:hypothetical protein OUZ56_000001 [Daphnia magna]